MPYLPRLHSDDETRWWIANMLLPEHDVFLIRDATSRTILGFAAIQETWLEHLYIAPAEQGKGYGSQLLEHVIDHHNGELLLHVFQRNDQARLFYDRHGFELVETSDGSRNEEGEPDATYRHAKRSPAPDRCL